MHKGVHPDCSACAPFFFIYAILRDRNTTLNDRHTYVNLYIISIDSQSIESTHRYSNHKRYFYPPSWLKKGLAFINNKPINHGDNYKFNIYQIWILLFSWKKSNQKFKAAPASLLRILRSLSPPKLAALKQRMLRTLSTAAALNARQLRPFRERKAFSWDGRYSLLKLKVPVILY